MVAQLRPVPESLELLCEPDRPTPDAGHTLGWLRVKGQWERNPAWDRQGALIQHLIVRYYVHGVTRGELAAELHQSPRQVQSWLSGNALPSYGRPVRRALADLGIGLNRGGGAMSGPSDVRNRQVINACMFALEMVAGSATISPRLRDLARLLSAGRGPLRWV